VETLWGSYWLCHTATGTVRHAATKPQDLPDRAIYGSVSKAAEVLQAAFSDAVHAAEDVVKPL
jgi:hypothetical protein